jgi:DNA-binding FadR family transcriptional regulator
MTRRTGLIDATVAQLRARITSGDWPVGSRIPPEPALVELLGVGRNTVREAVQSLVHAGLVERRQGSGTYVLSASELAVSMGRQIADARQRDVIEVRRSLEVEAARRMVAADLALHRAIARAARNPVLLSMYENLIGAITDNIRFNFAQILQDGDNHDGLVDAIAAGDDTRAVDETTSYLSGLLGED